MWRNRFYTLKSSQEGEDSSLMLKPVQPDQNDWRRRDQLDQSSFSFIMFLSMLYLNYDAIFHCPS